VLRLQLLVCNLQNWDQRETSGGFLISLEVGGYFQKEEHQCQRKSVLSPICYLKFFSANLKIFSCQIFLYQSQLSQALASLSLNLSNNTSFAISLLIGEASFPATMSMNDVIDMEIVAKIIGGDALFVMEFFM
jgi:hypothetical protein